jgi:hypothetical protein
MTRSTTLRAVRLACALALAPAGCTPYQPPAAVAPVKQREPKYVLTVVVDVSGSFDRQLDEKAWPFLQKVIRDFYRDRAGEDDLLVIGQISAVPVAPIFEGSPRAFARRYGSAAAFRDLLREKSNPNGSRVHDSVADVARYAARYSTDANQTFLCVLSDFEENFPDPDKSEERLVQALAAFARPTAAVGFYWVDLRHLDRWERNLRRAGVAHSVVRSGIEADPPLPSFAAP